MASLMKMVAFSSCG